MSNELEDVLSERIAWESKELERREKLLFATRFDVYRSRTPVNEVMSTYAEHAGNVAETAALRVAFTVTYAETCLCTLPNMPILNV